jgi:two-component system, chemotaxis family, sensor kinase CheA
MNDSLQKQLINDLLIESFEGLDGYDANLLALEQGTTGETVWNDIFRTIHTIKGTSGCLGLGKIEKVAHVGENLLDLLRSRVLQPNQGMISTLLKLSDALREMLRHLEASGSEGDTDYSPLQLELQNHVELRNADAPPAAAENKAVPETTENDGFGFFAEPHVATAPVADPKDESAGFGFFEETPAVPTRESTPPPQPTAPVAPSVPLVRAPAPPAGEAPRSAAADSAIRVDVSQLDKLMNLVGELVLTRNQIIQKTTGAQDPALITAAQRLNIITTELQEGVMKTRMQPIGNVWSKFPRIVRDVAHELGKQVRLEMKGKETELDRTIIEAIKDPLIHIVRNSIDHGIESPENRREAGKPDEGTLSLRAFHEGGQVNIEIVDDGAGINIERVKAKAIEKGLLGSELAAKLTEREALNLIFLPGFSTAAKITNVSGRGVGMDVVKTNIEKIGGSVDISSEFGGGTTMKIKIPLTLAIIPALIVTAGGERFAIPQVSLLELVRIDGDQAEKSIEYLYGAPVYRLRGQLLPLAYLSKELAISDEEIPDARNIVVLQADGRQFGLVVEEINDTEEIVVKPLGKQLKGIPCYSGATIMGDGRVALIIDVLGLAQKSRVISETPKESTSNKRRAEEAIDNRQTLLVFDTGSGNRMAIPLSLVARLEEIPRDKVEFSGGQQVVQYRGQLLPLIPVSQFIARSGVQEAADNATMHVVVYSEQGRSAGLIVSRIDDIVQESLTVQRDAHRNGILGSAVIQGKVTDLLDAPGIIRSFDPNFFELVDPTESTRP